MSSLHIKLPGLVLASVLHLGFAPLRAEDSLMRAEAKVSATTTWHFLNANSVDLKELLPQPPAPKSPAAEADLETILQVQVSRTPEQIDWAKSIEQDNVYKYASVLGSWFTAEQLPITAAIFKQIQEDGALASRDAKTMFNRPRPPKTDPRVQPCVQVPASSSYPSGHSSQAWMWATILSEIFPEKSAELHARARAVAWGRVIGGAHFPSDIMAGKILGVKIAEELLKSPALREAIKRSQQEAAPFLLKKAA